MLKFEQYIDMTKYNDSNELDSGLTICELLYNGKRVTIEVKGYVKLFYKDECYRHASEMPQEVLDLIHNGKIDACPDAEWAENNWFEIFWGEDDTHCPDSDVVDIEGYTPDQLLALCWEVISE